MSIDFHHFKDTLIVRGEEAERLVASIGEIRLLMDSNAVGGAASVIKTRLEKGAPGARPHRHNRSAEMFYILDGHVRILSGKKIVTAAKGDVIVVPPGVPHAFSAEPDSTADILILIMPGLERFEYFRKLHRVMKGQETRESLEAVAEIYDTTFTPSPEWDAANG
jgi:quercetin dioxygenase-like cupin family protein